MKDYYYILGVNPDASAEEIRKAYRKLSTKFHPDKNDGDEFFSERFKEIQEAWETLGDNFRRSIYNSNRENNNSNKDITAPQIVFFKANKSSIYDDDEVEFSWKTNNADKLTLKPFGTVTPTGKKTYRVKNITGSKLTFELIAENTQNLNSANSFLIITKKDITRNPKQPQKVIKKGSRGEMIRHLFFGILLPFTLYIIYANYSMKHYLIWFEPVELTITGYTLLGISLIGIIRFIVKFIF